MGNQQKLLLVSSLFIVGVGILTGIRKYHSSQAEANLNVLMIDVLNIASKAQLYYYTPKYLSGGGRSFVGLTSNKKGNEKLFGSSQNENGTFQILQSDDDQSIII